MSSTNYSDTVEQPLNRGTSYLVAPHNVTFNKKGMDASNANHIKVVNSLQGILDKHDAKESRAVKGMSPEMMKMRKT